MKHQLPTFSSGIFTPVITILGFLISVQSSAQAEPLVRVVNVEPWVSGTKHTVHCRVDTPYLHQLSSHGEARLDWLKPPGSKVEKGQLIARQHSYYLQREVTRLSSDRDIATEEAEYLSSEYHRIQALDELKLVSQSSLKDLARRNRQAGITEDRLNNDLAEARYRLEHASHYSPVDGHVIDIQAAPGELLRSGANILRIQAEREKELICEVPLALYRQTNALGAAQFSLLSGEPLKLIRRGDQLREDTQGLNVYLKPTGDSTALLFGERLEVNLGYDEPGLSRLPYDALELDKDTHYVWRLNEKNQVTRKVVRIAASQENHVLIVSDLKPGDRVITTGKKGLSNDQQVTPLDANDVTMADEVIDIEAGAPS